MYIKGIEIANCYDEETDKDKILSYYKREQAILEKERKLTGDTISASDLSFASLEMPQCSGGAIGLDRLLLVEYGGDEIAPILSFPMCSMLNPD